MFRIILLQWHSPAVIKSSIMLRVLALSGGFPRIGAKRERKNKHFLLSCTGLISLVEPPGKLVLERLQEVIFTQA